MARAIFSHELSDPDFQWLISSYNEHRGGTALVDSPCLPIVMVNLTSEERTAVLTPPDPSILPSVKPDSADELKEPSAD